MTSFRKIFDDAIRNAFREALEPLGSSSGCSRAATGHESRTGARKGRSATSHPISLPELCPDSLGE